jgi:hypothetical protein
VQFLRPSQETITVNGELTLRPIVVIRKCPMPREKDDSQLDVVCMFDFVILDTGNRLSPDRGPCRFSGMRLRYTPGHMISRTRRILRYCRIGEVKFIKDVAEPSKNQRIWAKFFWAFLLANKTKQRAKFINLCMV